MRVITQKMILLALLPFAAVSCGDDLPRETNEGSNTFGMLVDGEKWESPILGYNPTATYYPDSKDLIIYAKNKYDEEGITIIINNIDKSGKHSISYKSLLPIFTDSTRLSNGDDLLTSYVLLSESESEINFTRMDTINNVVAATFYMKLVNRTGEIISISSGRFDIDLSVDGH